MSGLSTSLQILDQPQKMATLAYLSVPSVTKKKVFYNNMTVLVNIFVQLGFFRE
jgi:hypothetical protein